jgi:hypothetical protein
MPSSGMLHHLALVGTEVSEECIASIIRVKRISELGTTLTVTRNRGMKYILFLCSMLGLLVTDNVVLSYTILVTLMLDEIHSSKTLVLTRTALHNIPGDGILHSHHHENLRSYHVLLISNMSNYFGINLIICFNLLFSTCVC